MPLPLPSLLKLASSFLPVIGGILSAAAGKKGDTALATQITNLTSEVGHGGGLSGDQWRDVALANIAAETATIQAAAETAQVEADATARINAETNKTIRSEVDDPDKYRRRWRPTLAYMLTLCIGVGAACILYAFTWTARHAPDNLPLVTTQIGLLLDATLEPLRMILGLLGGAVVFRSVEKLVGSRARGPGAGAPPTTSAPNDALRAAASVLVALGGGRKGRRNK